MPQIIDDNYVTISALAEELGIPTQTINSWIRRKQITFHELKGAKWRRYLVDRRTAPVIRSAGRPSN